jgi:YegS/Rv2252/BmrU family lipid kinase
MMLIINPHSGRGLSKIALGTIVSRLCDADYIVTVYFAHDKTPEELAYEYSARHDLAVCVGGDGTLNGVISGLLRTESPIPVGYIPAGTSNDVATTLALSRDPSIASRKILMGTPKALDIGRMHERYFTYIAAFGAFTGVSYSTPQSAKRSLGHFAYVLGGLADMAMIKPRHTIIEYDGKTIEGDFIFGGVTNSTSVAGLVKLNPKHVDLADGMFEIILVKQPIVLADFLDIMSSLTVQTYDGDNVQMLHASNVRFIFWEEVAWTIDGEDGGKHKKVEITNCHKAIEIVM